MSLQPFTQPTSDEYQTWPMIRVRSAWSGGWGSPMARMMMPSISRPHLLLALDGRQVGRGQGGEHRRHQLGLASHGPQGPFEDVEDPFRGDRPAGRHLGQAGVELLHPVDEGGGQEMVLGGEVAVDGAHGHMGPGGHVAHLDGLVAPLEAELHGGVDDPLPPRLLSTGQGPGKRPLLHGDSRYSGSCLGRNPFYSRPRHP